MNTDKDTLCERYLALDEEASRLWAQLQRIVEAKARTKLALERVIAEERKNDPNPDTGEAPGKLDTPCDRPCGNG